MSRTLNLLKEYFKLPLPVQMLMEIDTDGNGVHMMRIVEDISTELGIDEEEAWDKHINPALQSGIIHKGEGFITKEFLFVGESTRHHYRDVF
jgi:hypothetical protein